jgi:hypothetical protein
MIRWIRNTHAVKPRFDALRADFDALHNADEAADIPVHAADGDYGEMVEWTAGAEDPLRKILRRQPLASCLVSLGAGAILGAVLLRLS